MHGLTKLTNALLAKNITFEKVGSVIEAKGKLIIVTGLSLGEDEAAQMLKAENHVVPEVSELKPLRRERRIIKLHPMQIGMNGFRLPICLLQVFR